MVGLYCDSFCQVPRRITLDIDDTSDAVHGGQQPRLFDAYYEEYGFPCQRRSNSRPVWRSKSRPLVRGVMLCSQAPDRGPGCKVAPAKSVRIV
jgi:hypothetical protein